MKLLLLVNMAVVCHAVLSVPQKVLIIRHAEKLDQKDCGPYLSQCGVDRSLKLPAYFVSNFPLPVAIYAQGQKKETSSLRAIQTMAPTATHLMQISPENAKEFVLLTDYEGDEEKELAQEVLTTTDYDDKVVYICWSHQTIEKLAEQLGVEDPPKWPSDVFDWVWVITYDTKTKKVENFQNLTMDFTVCG